MLVAASAAAEFLHKHDASSLTTQQHLALLSQLLDDVMGTSLIRDLLAHRWGSMVLIQLTSRSNARTQWAVVTSAASGWELCLKGRCSASCSRPMGDLIAFEDSGHLLKTSARSRVLTCRARLCCLLSVVRLEEAQEAAAGLREQLNEARRKLREVLDEERELKKRRKAAALALATVRRRL